MALPSVGSTLPSPRALLFAAAALTACGGDGGDAGAGDEPDAGREGAFADAQVVEGQWSFVPVDGMTCMDGSATGIGVNLNRASDKLVIVYEGGGACFNEYSCAGAFHQNGYRAVDLDAFARNEGRAGLFDRADLDNPVRAWSYVFVPYCTGDIHAGDNPSSLGGRRAVGYVNSTLAVSRVRDELGEGLSQVLLTGYSAGGFGALYNYDQVQRIFGDVPVDLLDDSGPPVSATYFTPCLDQLAREVWNLEATLPAGCAECRTIGLGALIPYYSAALADRRQGYIASLEDEVLRQFFGFGYPSCDQPRVPMDAEVFRAAIEELRGATTGLANVGLFTLESDEHVFTIGRPLANVRVGDSTLAAWIGELVGGDRFTSVGP